VGVEVEVRVVMVTAAALMGAEVGAVMGTAAASKVALVATQGVVTAGVVTVVEKKVGVVKALVAAAKAPALAAAEHPSIPPRLYV
jgi:hypothetical protein